MESVNKLWKEKFEHDTMMLHAHKVKFVHPISQKEIEIVAPYSPEFERGLEIVTQKIIAV
jgi:tRNA pseudouridine65 synthase